MISCMPSILKGVYIYSEKKEFATMVCHMCTVCPDLFALPFGVMVGYNL